MSTALPDVADRFLAAWAEPDPVRRRRGFARVLADDLVYSDPHLTVDLHDAASYLAFLDALHAGSARLRLVARAVSPCRHSHLIKVALIDASAGVVAEGFLLLEVGMTAKIVKIAAFGPLADLN